MNRFFSKKWLILFTVLLLIGAFGIAANCGCSVGYVVHAGVGQIDLMMSRQPVEEMLSDPDTSADIKEKLQIILEAKKYGEEEIGLAHTDAYTTYAPIDGPAAVWNFMAAPPLKLEPVTWWFPVVGRMPYLGFFDKEKALKKEARLKKKGLDTYVRGASAYSTLGWFNDPIFSPILKYDIPTLVNITIHEMTHTTVFLEGHVAYNEGMALFVGNQGSLEFLAKKYGPDSEEVRIEQADIHNDQVFSAFLLKLNENLKKLYDSDLPDDQKLKEKERIFTESREEFKKLPFKGKAYSSFLERELNNASILSRSIYYVDLEMYEDLYKANGSDLRKMVDFFKETEKLKVKDPGKYTREYIRKQ